MPASVAIEDASVDDPRAVSASSSDPPCSGDSPGISVAPVSAEGDLSLSTNRGTVLLVDACAPLLRAMSRTLKSVGFNVTSARAGAEAIALLGSLRFDVIVSDISMPGMRGMEVLRTVRAKDALVPVLLMTGAPTLESATEALAHGAFRYL